MKSVDELFDNAIGHWRDKRCVGSCIIPPPLNDKCIILGVLQRIYTRSPDAHVTIFLGNFKDRIEIIEFLTQQENEENNEEFKQLINNKVLRLLTIDYIERNGSFMTPYVTIVYHCDSIGKHLEEILIRSRFKLVVLSKLMSSVEDMNKLYNLCPLIDDFKQNELDELRTSTPVEERWIGIDIPEDTEASKLLAYYNEYIITSIRIFGSLDNVQQARVGNTVLNISANQICYQIAYDNGWNENLDMSIQINVQLDELYNPNSLHDRASQTYEIIRNRSQFLSDYEGKLEEIFKIVEENKDKKILIISKRGEFANKITEYINTLTDEPICGGYHDRLDPIPAIDLDGYPVYYKSGAQKGKRKQMCAQAQKTRNEHLFNIGKLNVLCTNGAPDKELNIDVDVIIITSPLCEDIKSYMYRLSNVRYPSGKIKLYSIYIKNSIEQTRLQNKPLANNHQIINKCESLVVNENNSDFILVD